MDILFMERMHLYIFPKNATVRVNMRTSKGEVSCTFLACDADGEVGKRKFEQELGDDFSSHLCQ